MTPLQLYCMEDEIAAFEKIVKSIEGQDVQGVKVGVSDLMLLARARIRR
ncbi:MAG: hypothetical protein JRJ27_21645 [Deltaproteobacteria bacterium]|nr:hypothetical protein [Deltaproteobacteria bacterium]